MIFSPLKRLISYHSGSIYLAKLICIYILLFARCLYIVPQTVVTFVYLHFPNILFLKIKIEENTPHTDFFEHDVHCFYFAEHFSI